MFLIKLSGDVEINPGPKSGTNQILRKNQTVKCLDLNARSLMSVRKTNYGETVSNLERFQNCVYTEDIDIVFINETWLSHSINNAEILHAGYIIVRNDREGRGVLLGIKTEIFKSIREIEHNYNLEVVLAELTTFMDSKIIICSCYRPPNADRIWMENFSNFINVCSRRSKIILAGDFNLPRARWNACENLSGVNENTFVRMLDDNFLEHINKFPTRENNILNLVISSIPTNITVSEVLKQSVSEILTDQNAIISLN